MYEIEKNKESWSLISEEHYKTFKKLLADENYKLNPFISEELGDIKGKKILHLQCNTGADSILLARKGAIVTGVDLVPDNIKFARQLAEDFQEKNVSFVVSDIMELMENHEGKYDIVFTSEGAIGWLPDLEKWGKTIRFFLKEEGYFYLHDSHPTFLIFDEEELKNGKIVIKYPYFKEEVEKEEYIGGYASDSKPAEAYYWSYKMSDIVNALSKAGIYIEYMKEYDKCSPGMGGSKKGEDGFAYYPEFKEHFPIMLSIKAIIK